MEWLKHRHIKNSFFPQLDSQDCGIACLMSVLRYFKLFPEYAVLSQQVQLSNRGASMLDLKNTALQSGCNAEAFRMDLSDLQKQNSPLILHTVNAQGANHFMVYYRYRKEDETFLIGDPARGIRIMETPELVECWKSKAALLLSPNGTAMQSFATGKWRWLLSLVHQEKFLLLLITFLGVLTAFMGLSLAIYLQVLTDKILPLRNYGQMLTGLSLLAFLFIARALIVNYRQRIVIAMITNFNKHLVREFSRHLINLPSSFLNAKTTGDMVVRFNDTQNIQLAFSTVVSLILVDMVMLLAVTGFLFSYSIPIASCIILFIALTIAFAYYNADTLKTHQQELTADFSRTNNQLIATVNGLRQDSPMAEDLNLESKGFYNFIGSTEKFATTVRKLSIRFDLIGSFFFAGILFYSSMLVMDQTYTKGQFLAMITLVSGIFPVVQRICTTGMVLMDGVIALDRVYTMVLAATGNAEKNQNQHDNS